MPSAWPPWSPLTTVMPMTLCPWMADIQLGILSFEPQEGGVCVSMGGFTAGGKLFFRSFKTEANNRILESEKY